MALPSRLTAMLPLRAEEKFTKFSGKPGDATEKNSITTCFWTNFGKNWYEIAGGDAAGFLNFGPEVEIRI